MKELLKDILFFIFLLILPYVIMFDMALCNSYNPTYPDHTMHPYETEEERNEAKQIEYVDVIKRQYEESHAYCHYCKEYFHKDDLYEVFIFLACKDCYEEANQIDYSQFCE